MEAVMSIVKRNISVHMIRDSLDDIPDYPLPSGYSAHWHQPGNGGLWVDVQSRAEGYLEITAKLFVEQFGSDPRPLAERQCFLCDARGRAIGTATAWFDDDYCGQPYGQLHWVAIVPEAQGQGLAKPLLSIVLTRMADLGHTRCYLGTSTARIPAINLYRKFGFVPHVRNADELAVWREMQPLVKTPFELDDGRQGCAS
jgi:GNAT superfamily N-acetyltransferase